MQGEDCDSGGYEGHNKVFVERIAFAEDGEVQEHDWEKLAGFGKDEGNVVDMSKRSVAKGRR